jgi:hypothetical protein
MLFQYDRCLLEQDIGVIAMRGSIIHDEETKIITVLQSEFGKLDQDKYFLFEENLPYMNVSRNSITVESGGAMTVSLPSIITPLTPQHMWKTEIKYQNKRQNSVLFIRTCHMVENLLDRLD